MIRLLCACCAIFLGSLNASGAIGPQGPVEAVTWDELESTVQGHRVSIALPNGVEVEGTAVTVRPEGLALEITQSSDQLSYPEGPGAIDRDLISTVRIQEETRGWANPVLATVAGVGAGLPFIEIILLEERRDQVPRRTAEYVGITAGAAVGGYFIGKAVSDTERVIRVIDTPVSGALRFEGWTQKPVPHSLGRRAPPPRRNGLPILRIDFGVQAFDVILDRPVEVRRGCFGHPSCSCMFSDYP